MILKEQLESLSGTHDKTSQTSDFTIKLRKGQVEREIDKIRAQAATKTRRHFKSDRGFEEWKQRSMERIVSIQAEFSILSDPGEYEELPIAVVAEELGVSISAVQNLLSTGELEPIDISDESAKDRISREELERALDVGIDELLKRADQEPARIFEQAVEHLRLGDLGAAEKAHSRIKVRESLSGDYGSALQMALNLAKGELEEVHSDLRFLFKWDQMDSTTMLAYLGRALRVMKLEEHCAQALLEHILAIVDGGKVEPYEYIECYKSKKIGGHLDDTQRRAMYVSTAVQRSLSRYKFLRQFQSFYDRASPMREEQFETLIRNTIYTALYAEENSENSAASKMYLNSITALIPRWWAPAELMEHLPRDESAAEGMSCNTKPL